MAGRPRKFAPRYANGKVMRSHYTPRQETPKEARAVVIAYRSKIVAPEHAGRPEAGYELGRMYLAGRLGPETGAGGNIARRRLDAGNRWSVLVRRYQIAHGFPNPHPPGMDFSMVARGIDCGSIPDEDDIQNLSKAYTKALSAIADAGVAGRQALNSVCVFDEECRFAPNLWITLDSLADHWGLPLDG